MRLTPRGGRDRIDGVAEDAEGRPMLAVRVSAPPVDGAANKALVALIAKALKLRRSDVEIVSGDTARVKRLSLAGDPADLSMRLVALAT